MQNDLNLLNEKLCRSEKKYRNIFESVTEGVFRSKPDGCLVEVNPAMAGILGYDSPEHILAGQNQSMGNPFLGEKEYQSFLSVVKERGLVRNYQTELYRNDGWKISIEISAHAVHDDGGALTHIEGILFDVTERKRMHEELKRLADTDGLTGLYNRRYLLEKLDREVCRARSYNRPLSLIMIDADYFKSVNDRYGHDVGDRVLRQIAGTCRNILRENDILGRVGGEEFAVILPGADLEKARQVAERLRSGVENNRLSIQNGEVRITISVGLAQLNSTALDTKNLMKQADTALYCAKRNGRNLVCGYSEMDNK
ncbi:MAG: sensor domain-containing diguanylate cyclase [Deltaproteobacteria bacterium]|nr:sensor domain-containing diguanylate cyclase [Deltaproteobacteria bacterium]